MSTRAELKTRAKAQIKGNIGILFLCGLIFAVICSTCIGCILAPALILGFMMIFLALTQGQKPQVGDLFKGVNLFGRSLWLCIIVGIFTFLWSLLLVVPGIIKSLSYSMSYFVLAENPQMTAREALNESKKIMSGHKMELFVLYLSFILWMLLGAVTLGIAYIYIAPYMYATITNFYQEIKRPIQIAPEEIPA